MMATHLRDEIDEILPGWPRYLIYRLSVAQYLQMADAAILTENDEVELLEGWIIIKHTPDGSDPFYRLSVAQYDAMIDAAILTEDDPVELLEGLLVTKMPKNFPHTKATQTLRDLLPTLVSPGCFVNDQEPIKTTDSEPEPDLMVLRGRRQDYSRQPFAEDVPLVIEVSDATLRRDRTLKLRIYARARIPVYWIVNLIDNRLEVYSDPFGDGSLATYRQHTDYPPTDEVPLIIDGQEVARLPLSELFR